MNPSLSGSNRCEVGSIQNQFDAISPENALKWDSVHRKAGRYDFNAADRYVNFGESNRMFIVGHTLVWHNQTPNGCSRIATAIPSTATRCCAGCAIISPRCVGRYRGRIPRLGCGEQSAERRRHAGQSPWMKIIGEDYLFKAYEFARQADPQAQLYYNDFSLENTPKRQGAVALIRKLQSRGVTIAAVGLQGHYKLDWPAKQDLENTIDTFAALGVKVMITELDLDVLPPATQSQDAEVRMNFELESRLNPYTNGLPDSMQQALTSRLRGAVRGVRPSPRKHRPRHLLGSDGCELVAEQLARQRPDELPAAVRPPVPAQTRFRSSPAGWTRD